MSTSSILSPDRVELDGVSFRLVGGVNRSKLSQWASKVVTGDTDRDSDPHRSTVGFSDLRGGVGLHIMEGASDSNRLFWGTHDTRFERHMLHPPLAHGPASTQFPSQFTIPIPAGVTHDISFMETFANELYVGFGTQVYKWSETLGIWSLLLHTLPGVAQGTLVTRVGGAQKVYLLVACGDDGYTYFDGTDWTDVTTQQADFLVWWDYRLWALASNGQLSKASGPGETWTEDAWLPLPDGFATAMFKTSSATAVTAIHVVSKDGTLWIHDANNEKFIEIDLDLPSHPDTGVGTSVWRQNFYIPSGLAIYRINNRGNELVVDSVGPDNDAGIPLDRNGRIVQLLPTQTSLIALIEGGNTSEALSATLSPMLGSYPDLVHSSSQNVSTIMERVFNGWQVLWAGGQDGQVPVSISSFVTVGTVTDAYGKYRLWWGVGRQLWYIDLLQNIINPLQIPDRMYAYYAVSITPWFHANVTEAHKVALNVLTETRNLFMGGGCVFLDVGFDYNDDNWTQVAVYDDSALHDPEFLPAVIDEDPEQGRIFRAIRFRIRSQLGPNQMISPDMVSLTLEYYKRLGIQQKYEFTLTVDLSTERGGLTAGVLNTALTDAVEKANKIKFRYRDATHYVNILSERRWQLSGTQNNQARSTLVLAEI